MGILTRFLAAITELAETRDYISLDCRDGRHDACAGCDCPHHAQETR